MLSASTLQVTKQQATADMHGGAVRLPNRLWPLTSLHFSYSLHRWAIKPTQINGSLCSPSIPDYADFTWLAGHDILHAKWHNQEDFAIGGFQSSMITHIPMSASIARCKQTDIKGVPQAPVGCQPVALRSPVLCSHCSTELGRRDNGNDSRNHHPYPIYDHKVEPEVQWLRS